MKRLLILSAISFLGFSTSAAGQELPDDVFTEPPGDSVQKLLILGDDFPVIVLCQIEVNGRSFRRNHRDFLVRLHTYLDQNRDGVLKLEELDMNNLATLLSANPFDRSSQRRSPSDGQSKLDENEDERISLQELSDYMVTNLNARPSRVEGGPAPDPRSERAFNHLDLDGNGSLDDTERAKAFETFTALDRNEDEWVTIDEMDPYSDPRSRQFFGIRTQPAGLPTHPFLVLDDDQNMDEAIQQMFKEYDSDSNSVLDANELGLPHERFGQIDQDGNNSVDKAELQRWLDQATPDLEIESTLLSNQNRRRSGESISLKQLRVGPLLADRVEKASGIALTLDLGPTIVEFRSSTNLNNYRSFFEQQFDNADGDNNDYLDREEVERNPNLKNIFSVADRDGNGMLFKEELTAYLDQSDLAVGSTVTLAISDRGRTVFESLDPDSNQRLSLRECLGLGDRLETLNANDDALLDLDEFPKRYRFNIGLGSDNASGGVFFVSSSTQESYSSPNSGKNEIPSWFVKMDRNKDGDVSLREYLGPLDTFAQFDDDGDRLLSPAEVTPER